MKKWVKGIQEKGNWYEGKQLTQEQMTPRAGEAVLFCFAALFHFKYLGFREKRKEQLCMP